MRPAGIVLLISLYLLNITFSIQGVTQTSAYLNLRDSLQVLERSGDLLAYLDLLKNTEAELLSKEDHVQIVRLDQFYPGFRSPENSSERKKVRYYLMHHAYKLFKTRDFQHSIPFYLQAHELLENRLTGDDLAWYVENQIGNIYVRLGDFNRANYFFDITENALVSGDTIPANKEKLCRLSVNRGLCYLSAENIQLAVSEFRKGYEIAGSEGFVRAQLSCALQLGNTYLLMSALDTARYYLNVATPLLEEVKNNSKFLEYKSALNAIWAKLALLENDADMAEEKLHEAIQALKAYYQSEERREFAKLHKELAKTHLRNQSYDKTDIFIQKGLKAIIPSYERRQRIPEDWQIDRENTFMELLVLNAQLFRQLYTETDEIELLDTALMSIDLAYIANDKLREKYIDRTEQLLSIKDNKKLFDQSISLCYKLYEKTGDQKYVEKAFALSERSKSLLFKKRLEENQSVSSLVLAIKDSLSKLEQDVLKWRVKSAESRMIKDSLYPLILENEQKISTILNEVKQPAERRKPKKRYVEFVIGEELVYSLDNFKQKQRFSLHGKKDSLYRLLDQFNQQIVDKKSAVGIASQLYDFLLGDIEPLPKRFTIIPDARLAKIPFDALAKGDRLLLYDHEISYAYHRAQISNGRSGSIQESILCIHPHYEKAPNTLVAQNRKGMYHLPYTQLETDEIATLFRDHIQVVRDVSRQDLEASLMGKSILHFAGHAKVDGDHAYLVLKNHSGEQLYWHDYEIRAMRNHLDLVVLSACETGLGEFMEGEGIQSLGRSFQESGTASCLLSLWNVNDRSTADLMTSFYKYLKKGKNKTEALRLSKLDFIKRASPGVSAPYYWSGFVVVGDTGALFEKSGLTWLHFLLIVTSMGIAYILFHYLRKMRKL